MGDLINRFLSFDKLIGTSLIKILYYIGLVLIALSAVLQMLGALALLVSEPLAALGLLIIAPIGGAIAVLFWRFLCELYLLLFRMSDDLRDIRTAKLGDAPGAGEKAS